MIDLVHATYIDHKMKKIHYILVCKISKDMRKACMSTVKFERLESVVQAIKLVNEQMECNVNVQTMNKILKIAKLET